MDCFPRGRAENVAWAKSKLFAWNSSSSMTRLCSVWKSQWRMCCQTSVIYGIGTCRIKLGVGVNIFEEYCMCVFSAVLPRSWCLSELLWQRRLLALRGFSRPGSPTLLAPRRSESPAALERAAPPLCSDFKIAKQSAPPPPPPPHPTKSIKMYWRKRMRLVSV